MSWFINSMRLEIDENVIFYETIREIWNAAKQTYFDKENTSELCEIDGAFLKLRQGYLSWLNISTFSLGDGRNLTGSNLMIGAVPMMEQDTKWFSKKEIFKFLLGLDKSRGCVLGTKLLSYIMEVFSEVRCEESKRKVMPCSLTSEASALVVCWSSSSNQDKKERPKYEHRLKMNTERINVGISMGNRQTTNWNKDVELLLQLQPRINVLIPRAAPSPRNNWKLSRRS